MAREGARRRGRKQGGNGQLAQLPWRAVENGYRPIEVLTEEQLEAMRAGGYNLGGEQSGHIVMTDYATTGDGLLAGLQFLAEMKRTDRNASELRDVFTPVPQLLKNVRFEVGATPLDAPSVKAAIEDAKGRLNGKGRLLIRKSGTEPLIRVMAECEYG